MIIDSPIISGSYAASGSLNQLGNVVITGSLTVTGDITGNITGSATNAVSASFATTAVSASYAANTTSASYAAAATSASYANNATSASYALNSTSASYAVASTSASYAANATSASFSSTASYLENYIPPFPFTGSAGISGSLTVNGNITAQTLIVQTITSSEDFVTGSTHFGSIIDNTHQFTGSVTISGSLAVNGSSAVLTNQTGAMSVATASYVANAQTASYVETAQTASYVQTAQTASFVQNAQTASYVLNAVSSSYAVSSSNASTASYVENAQTASFVQTAQTASFVANAQSASYVLNAVSASYAASASNASAATSASYALTASYASNVPETSSFAISASQSQNAVSASYALTASFAANVPVTASYANNAATASFSLTSSYSLSGGGFPYSGSAEITGSLLVSNLSGTGVRYIVADATGSLLAQTPLTAIKLNQVVTASAGQNTFNIPSGYTTGLIDTFINGTKLIRGVEYTDLSGTQIILTTGSFAGDIVEFVVYQPASGVTNNALRALTTFTASAGQTVFSASYTPGLIDIFYNGSRLSNGEYTANNGTFFTLATASAADDILDVFVYSYQVGAFSGIGGIGTANQFAYFNTSSSITSSNVITISGANAIITGSLLGTASFANSTPSATTASYVLTAQTASYVLTAQTASYVLNAVSSSFASTASSADDLLVRGTLTAQTLVVQTITSSVDFVTGSTRFGSISENTHQFTGSVSVSGSIISSSPITGSGFSTTANVNLGNFDLTSRYLISDGSAGLGGVISIRQDAAYLAKGNGYSSIAASFNAFDFFGYTGVSTYKNFILRFDGLTDNTRRTYTLPDNSGTLALLSGSQTFNGATTFASPLTGSSAIFSSSIRANAPSTIYGATQDAIQTIFTLGGQNASAQAKELYFRLTAGGTPAWTFQTAAIGTDTDINIYPNGTGGLKIAYTGAATFSSSVTAVGATFSGTTAVASAAGTSQMRIDRSGTVARIQNYDTGQAANISLAYDGGNVGIGTTGPAATLTVYKTRLASFTTQTPNQLYLQSQGYTGDGYNTIDFGSTSYGVPLARMGVGIFGDGTYITFGTSNSYATGITNTALTINPTGNVGIGSGTSGSPNNRLLVQGGNIAKATTFGYDGAVDNMIKYGAQQDINATGQQLDRWIGIDATVTAGGGSGNVMYFKVYSGGGSGSPRTAAFFNGDGSVFNYNNSTTWQQTSDIKIKDNIRPINDAIGKLCALKPSHFEYKNNLGKTKTGFIAQEFEEVFAGHVNENIPSGEFKQYFEEGEMMKSIDADLIPYLVKAIQEQQTLITALQEKLERNNII